MPLQLPALQPGRLGGIRGVGQQTLTGLTGEIAFVRSELQNVNTKLTALAVQVAALESGMTKLAGAGAAPAGWEGIPSAWGVGPSSPPATLARRLGDILTALEVLGEGSNAELLAQLVALNESVDSLETVVNSNILALYQQTVAISGNLSGLYVSIGDIASAPGFGTIKQLLGALVECCEEGNTAPPPTFQPPATGCDGAPANWREGTLRLVASTETEAVKVYELVFPGGHAEAPDLVSFERPIATGGTQSGMVSNATGPTDYTDKVCLAWQFDSSTPLYNMAFDNTSEANDLRKWGYTSYSNATPQSATTLQQYVFRPTVGPRNVMHVNFAFEVAGPPVGKVWVSVKPRVS